SHYAMDLRVTSRVMMGPRDCDTGSPIDGPLFRHSRQWAMRRWQASGLGIGLDNLWTTYCRTSGTSRVSSELPARRTRESKHLDYALQKPEGCWFESSLRSQFPVFVPFTNRSNGLVVHFTNALTFSTCTEIENMRPCPPDRSRRTDAANQSLSDRPPPRGSTGAEAASRRLYAPPFSGRPRQDDPLGGRRLGQ